MNTIRDQALCLRSRKYSETSQVLTLFSLKHGKIDAIAKGSRRAKSSFGGGVDVLTVGEIFFIPPRKDASLAKLTEFNLEESFYPLRDNLLALNCGQFICELLDKFTEEYDPHEELFRASLDALAGLAYESPSLAILIRFELILLRETGLMPVWDKCASCRKMLVGRELYFSSSSGGMLCRDCEPAAIEKRRVNVSILQLLQTPQELAAVDERVLFEFQDILSYYIKEQTGREPKTMTFLNHLLNKRIRKSY